MARLFPTSAGYPELEKEFKDNIVYTPQDSATFLVGTNIDRQSYKYTLRLQMSKRHQLRRLFSIKISVKRLPLVLIEQLMLLKSMEKAEQANFFVTCLYRQLSYKQMVKTLVS